MSIGSMSSESRPELGPRASLRSWTRFSNPLFGEGLGLEQGSVLMYGMLVMGVLSYENKCFCASLWLLYDIDNFGYRRIRKEV